MTGTEPVDTVKVVIPAVVVGVPVTVKAPVSGAGIGGDVTFQIRSPVMKELSPGDVPVRIVVVQPVSVVAVLLV